MSVVACGNSDDLNSFNTVDVADYNEAIKLGMEKDENWTNDPVVITHKLFTIDDGPGVVEIKMNRKDRLHAILTFTVEGPYDDSVEGEKRIIQFEKINNVWLITKMQIGFKCWKNRGHTNYTGEGCS